MVCMAYSGSECPGLPPPQGVCPPLGPDRPAGRPRAPRRPLAGRGAAPGGRPGSPVTVPGPPALCSLDLLGRGGPLAAGRSRCGRRARLHRTVRCSPCSMRRGPRPAASSFGASPRNTLVQGAFSLFLCFFFEFGIPAHKLSTGGGTHHSKGGCFGWGNKSHTKPTLQRKRILSGLFIFLKVFRFVCSDFSCDESIGPILGQRHEGGV